MGSTYQRYRVHTETAPNIKAHPNRFCVGVNRPRLARFLLQELWHQRRDLAVAFSRPCIYGVFSGPIGGFAARPQHCVGCLRCTVEHAEIVQVHPNPARLRLGDSYFSPDQVDTILYEASTGQIPVRGAGYRGAFAGSGWDAMWTDMSEIVRPTRDGIHGREYISTSVDLGEKLPFLTFDDTGHLSGEQPAVISLEVPLLFDVMPASAESARLYRVLGEAARVLETLAIAPLRWVGSGGSMGGSFLPLVGPSEVEQLGTLDQPPAVIELDGWGEDAFLDLSSRFPQALIIVRVPFTPDPTPLFECGVRSIHFTADYHGHTDHGFVLEAIRSAHNALVAGGVREQVTLIGSGGIIAAEHLAKAIICGLDAVALDTPLLVALQGRMRGECVQARSGRFVMPAFPVDWGVQRLVNMVGSWRDQMLEVLGAMGLREVRRLRGEVGRAMFQNELESEVFAGISGYGE